MNRLPVLFAIFLSLICTSAFAQQNAWQRIHGDQLNSGRGLADGSDGFGQWQYATTGAVDSSPAIDVNWNVYFGTRDGYLISLDEHGKLRWKFQAGGEVFSPAIGSDQNIYVGSADGNMYAVNAQSGSLIWKFKAKGPVRTTPVFDTHANVIFGSDDHNIYCLAIGNGTIVSQATGTSSFTLSPAIPDLAYFVSDDGNLIAFNSPAGLVTKVASNSAGYSTSPVQMPDGTVIVGSSDGNIYDYSLNGLNWTYKAASAISSTPAVGPDGTVYFGSQGGVLYAFNHAQPQNPQLNWVCIQPNGSIYSSPALGDAGVVYFGCDDGHLYATQYPGNVVWQVNVAGSKIRSSPAITFDGTVMVGAENNTFYAIGTQSPTPVASVSASPSSVLGGSNCVGIVTLTQSAPAGGNIVNLHVAIEPIRGVIPPTCAFVPPIIIVPQFQLSATFPITTVLPPVTETADITAVSGFTTVNTTLTIVEAPLISWQLNPTIVVGGNATSGTAVISEPAGPYGQVVNFGGGPDIPGPLGPGLIPAGGQTLQYSVPTVGVAAPVTAQVTANSGGVTKTAQLTINPANLVSITVFPTQVVGGISNSVGAVNLDGDPPPNGALVTLASSNTSVATVPSTLLIFIDRHGLHNTFDITTFPVTSNVDAKISATYMKKTVSADLIVTPPQLSTFVISPNSVLGGQSSTGTVTLTSVTPSGGIPVTLQTQAPDITLPALVTVPQGSSSASFTISSNGVPSNEVQAATASWDGVTLTANLTLTPPTVQSMSVGPMVTVGGSNVVLKGSVTLSGPSNPNPNKGDVVKLSSSDTTVANVSASSVTIAGGLTSAAFTVTTLPVISARNVTITATFNNTSQTVNLIVNPVQIAGVALAPIIVGGGSPSLGQVAVTVTAGPAGFLVKLSSEKPEATVQPTVMIPAGASVASFTVNTKAVTKQEDVRITGAYGTSSQTAILTLIPTTLGTLTVAPTSLVGGNNATGTVQLNGAAMSPGLKVSLSSSSGDATVPGSVTIPTGSTFTTFAIKTKGVAVTTVATLTAKLVKNTATAKLTIRPAPLQSVTVSPGTVVGGSSTVVTGTVTLAGFGSNTVVTLSSSNPSVASVPASVKVASGKPSATFAVTHSLVSSSQTVTITASSGGVTETATLVVNPLQVIGLSLTPTSVVGGKTSAGVVTLNALVGSKGAKVNLSSSSSTATVPATVSIGNKQSTGKFTVKTVKVTSTGSATITGSLGSSNAKATLSIIK